MAESPEIFELDDPTVVELGRFLRRARLSNGGETGIPEGHSELLAQACLNWLNNLVYDDGEWVTRAAIEATPELGAVEVTVIGDNEAIKMRHAPTGITVVHLTHELAWAELKQKVREVSVDA
ncbi:hypothetical protein [Rhodococcus daqingensis]|uniref:Uncharacterized protein n=1 Tax=Rhodococcus daqingensis TaxID=2479363 RepID=A0ABW2S490_9NOCA